MPNQSPNEIVNPRLSKTAVLMLLLACAAGCGSSGSPIANDGGPNDVSSATGGRDGSGGGPNDGRASTGGRGGSDGAVTGGSAAAVNLRSAGDYVILAESAITTVPP